MAIRLSLDLSGATCGELMRFAEAVRSAGVPPHQPIERSGPDRIEVSKAGGGPRSGVVRAGILRAEPVVRAGVR